ncbi:PadR family transcriptional regulator [Microbulbifer sp. SA54]|uniref:PadR family transcriptional regulator n=1 Tax=Microbulbifer sp. SA54 TaxID=3401577 RepID=UPI003AACE73A
MSLKHVILVSLANGSATGYEINGQFAAGLGRLWNTSHQAVYRALASMQKEGLVSFTEARQTSKPDKKIYQITDAGRQCLDRWLLKPQPPTQLNEDLMIKFFAGEMCPTDRLRDQVSEHLQYHRQNLASLEMIEQQYQEGERPLSRRARIQQLTLRRGILTERARVAWCLEAIALLSSMLELELA